MKTKNMRKKALLSSVAMLLVAVVALSGATYAWFTANNSATVSPIELKTDKSSNLVISDSATGTFTSTLTVDWSQTLVPCSGQTIGTFYTVTADTDAEITESEADTHVKSIQSGGQYLSRDIYVKSGVNCYLKLTDVTGAGVLAPALRIAIQVDDGTPVIYSTDSNDVGTFNCINGALASVGSNTVKYSDLYNKTTAATGAGVTYGTYTISALGTAVTNTIGATATVVHIYIWLEGNDDGCSNTLSGITESNLKLTFSSNQITS